MATELSSSRQATAAPAAVPPTPFSTMGDFFRRAFYASPVAIAIGTLAEGRHLEVNPSFLRQTGYSREEIIGRSSLELGIWANPADRVRIVQLLQAQQAVHDVEITIRTKQGERRRVLASVERIEVDGAECLLTLFQDITERTQAEAALRASEERYQLVTWVTTDAVWDWNLVTNEVQWSQGLRTGFGFPNEALRRHNWWQGQVHPDDLAQAEASVQAAIADGAHFWSGEYRFRRADDSYAHVLDRGYIVRTDQGQPLRMLGAMVDISERKAQEQLLEQRVEERTRELATLLTVTREIASTLDLEPLLGLILDELKMVIPYTAASILSREGDDLRGRAYRGPLPQTVVALVRGTVKNPIDAKVLATRQPLIIPDLLTDSTDVQALRLTAGARFDLYYQGIRCWMRVPLIVKDKVVGVLTLQHAEPAYFSARHAELALAFADQAAIAIENARLFGAVEESRRELAVLLQTSRKVAYTLELNDLLDLILEQLGTVLEYGGASILSLEGETLRGRAYRGPKPRDWILQFTMSVDNFIDRQVIGSRQPYLIPDMLDDTPATRYFRNALGDRFESLYAGVRSWLRIPLIARDKVVGMLSLHHAEANYFSTHLAELALAFADQAAVAIENAQLYEQTRQLAALGERQKLARELHDSVSQALYGIALGARTARTLLDRDPKKVADPLDYVLQQAEAGLTEMRALIFELRPESLAQEGLVVAIEKQAASLRARHQLDVQLALMPEPAVALNYKEVLYRIVQEALHNIVKHARATRVVVQLTQEDGALTLVVQDNGQGFDANGEFPGHLGLKSMRERAVQLGGTLTITSASGQGTRVSAQIPYQ